MKYFSAVASAVLLAGCTGTHREGISRYDSYDAVKVDQMVGNNVSAKVFEKTILCLNARRETRQVNTLTNWQISLVTNQTINSVTNQTVSLSTNYLITTMTNLAPLVQPAVVLGSQSAEGAETNVLVIVTNPPASLSTNLTISFANNGSATTAPNQLSGNLQSVRTYNHQITTISNNLTVSLMTNFVVTGETNYVVSYSTNLSIAAVTNVTITPTNGAVHDYFLYTELTPPPDFTPAPGENLILLVDGTRYAFAPTPAVAAFNARKGYNATLYRVPPDVLVAIANATTVQVRLRGTTSIIDRTLSNSSRQNFKEFMLKYFTPDSEPGTDPLGMAARETTASSAVLTTSAAPSFR
jgi:hypothetical protein